jgi:hypothetical protein
MSPRLPYVALVSRLRCVRLSRFTHASAIVPSLLGLELLIFWTMGPQRPASSGDRRRGGVGGEGGGTNCSLIRRAYPRGALQNQPLSAQTRHVGVFCVSVQLADPAALPSAGLTVNCGKGRGNRRTRTGGKLIESERNGTVRKRRNE